MATSLTLPALDRPWSLLDRLKASLVALVAADALFLLLIILATNTQHDVVKAIGKDSAPSVISAQGIKVEMADMDAEAANELLSPPGKGQEAAKEYETHREKAGEDLIDAARNITYSGEDATIKRIQFGLGEYEAKIQRARDFHERNDPQAIQLYGEATFLMENTLFQAADTLDNINATQLEKAYQADRSKAKLEREVLVGFGIIMLFMLLWIQWDLTQRVRRLLNPALACATILTLALLSFSDSHLSRSDDAMYRAKHDAFDSLHALWQARALAFASNADESKYLLPGDRTTDEAAFFEKALKISQSPDNPYPRLRYAKGFLQDELANITFDGEREAAQETIDTWNYYLAIDSRIRQDKKDGKIQDALTLCLGKNQGQSDWAFDKFDQALMHTVAINQIAFDKSVAAGFASLEGVVMFASIDAAAVAICCALGLFIRIREFL